MGRNKRETRAIQPDDGTETGRYQADQCKPTSEQPNPIPDPPPTTPVPSPQQPTDAPPSPVTD